MMFMIFFFETGSSDDLADCRWMAAFVASLDTDLN